jgi:flagellar secretion chaperone FliS
MVKNAYWGKKIETASPLGLVIIAYEGAINFLSEADKCMSRKDYKKADFLIAKARKIIQALRGALDTDIEEISGNLFALYRAIDALLLRAAANRDGQLIGQAVKMLASLKESWVELSVRQGARACEVSGAVK